MAKSDEQKAIDAKARNLQDVIDAAREETDVPEHTIELWQQDVDNTPTTNSGSDSEND